MGFLAMIFAILSILTAAMGVVVAMKIIPEIAKLPWTFWFGATIILLLGTIASQLSSRNE